MNCNFPPKLAPIKVTGDPVTINIARGIPLTTPITVKNSVDRVKIVRADDSFPSSGWLWASTRREQQECATHRNRQGATMVVPLALHTDNYVSLVNATSHSNHYLKIFGMTRKHNK